METGYIKLHRKFLCDWKAKNPATLTAWIWLLLNAEWSDRNGLKRGQVEFSTTQARTLWGMSRTTAIRFLKRCEADGDIIWERGRGGQLNGHRSGHQAGTITLCNYERYQGEWSLNGQQSGQQSGHSLKNKKEEDKKEESTPPIVPPLGDNTGEKVPEKKVPRKKTKTEASHDPVFLSKALAAIDLESYKIKYEPYGVNVDLVWEAYRHCVLVGGDKAGKDYPNPYDLVDFKGGFHTWCRNRARPKRTRAPTTAQVWDGFDPEGRKEGIR